MLFDPKSLSGLNMFAVAPFGILTPSIWSSLWRGNSVPKKYRTDFQNIFGKVPPSRQKCLKSTPGKSKIWLVLGRRGPVWAGNCSVWIQIGIETHWTPFGPHLGHLWTSFGPFLCFWIIAGLLLAGSLLFPSVPVWGHCWRYVSPIVEVLTVTTCTCCIDLLERWLGGALGGWANNRPKIQQ